MNALPPHAQWQAGESRFYTLDGIRGMAAVVVLVSHVAPSICRITVLRNWYAVDLFFIISGFVLCRVYEPRFASGLTFRRFMLQRYIRLYPLFAAGIVIGIVAELLAAVAHHSPFDGWQRAIAIVSGLAMLPSPTMQATSQIIPLNAVAWSLFFELTANCVYAVFWRRLRGPILPLVMAASAIDLLWLAHHGISFGGTSWASFWAGFPRVFFCFFTGVWIARQHRGRKRRTRLTPILLIFLLIILVTPWHDSDVRDVLVMMAILPPAVALASIIEPVNPAPYSLLGRMSYPIYAVHYPLFLCLARVLYLIGTRPEAFAPWGGIAFVGTIGGLGLFLNRYYDTRVRRWLTSKLLSAPSNRLTALSVRTARSRVGPSQPSCDGLSSAP